MSICRPMDIIRKYATVCFIEEHFIKFTELLSRLYRQRQGLPVKTPKLWILQVTNKYDELKAKTLCWMLSNVFKIVELDTIRHDYINSTELLLHPQQLTEEARARERQIRSMAIDYTDGQPMVARRAFHDVKILPEMSERVDVVIVTDDDILDDPRMRRRAVVIKFAKSHDVSVRQYLLEEVRSRSRNNILKNELLELTWSNPKLVAEREGIHWGTPGSPLPPP